MKTYSSTLQESPTWVIDSANYINPPLSPIQINWSELEEEAERYPPEIRTSISNSEFDYLPEEGQIIKTKSIEEMNQILMQNQPPQEMVLNNELPKFDFFPKEGNLSPPIVEIEANQIQHHPQTMEETIFDNVPLPGNVIMPLPFWFQVVNSPLVSSLMLSLTALYRDTTQELYKDVYDVENGISIYAPDTKTSEKQVLYSELYYCNAGEEVFSIILCPLDPSFYQNLKSWIEEKIQNLSRETKTFSDLVRFSAQNLLEKYKKLYIPTDKISFYNYILEKEIIRKESLALFYVRKEALTNLYIEEYFKKFYLNYSQGFKAAADAFYFYPAILLDNIFYLLFEQFEKSINFRIHKIFLSFHEQINQLNPSNTFNLKLIKFYNNMRCMEYAHPYYIGKRLVHLNPHILPKEINALLDIIHSKLYLDKKNGLSKDNSELLNLAIEVCCAQEVKKIHEIYEVGLKKIRNMITTLFYYNIDPKVCDTLKILYSAITEITLHTGEVKKLTNDFLHLQSLLECQSLQKVSSAQGAKKASTRKVQRLSKGRSAVDEGWSNNTSSGPEKNLRVSLSTENNLFAKTYFKPLKQKLKRNLQDIKKTADNFSHHNSNIEYEQLMEKLTIIQKLMSQNALNCDSSDTSFGQEMCVFLNIILAQYPRVKSNFDDIVLLVINDYQNYYELFQKRITIIERRWRAKSFEEKGPFNYYNISAPQINEEILQKNTLRAQVLFILCSTLLNEYNNCVNNQWRINN